MKARLYTDGGARGNPGPAGSGFVLYDLCGNEPGNKIFECGVYIGEATNNQAEYQAVILGLEKAIELDVSDIEVVMDSELAVKQINGEYKVKNEDLAKKFLEVYNLRQKFAKITFCHVMREDNKEADAQVNKAIDEALGL
jgi:ribonuclease HI